MISKRPKLREPTDRFINICQIFSLCVKLLTTVTNEIQDMTDGVSERTLTGSKEEDSSLKASEINHLLLIMYLTLPYWGWLTALWIHKHPTNILRVIFLVNWNNNYDLKRFYYLIFSSYLIFYHLISSSHLTSSHIISSHRISSHLIFSSHIISYYYTIVTVLYNATMLNILLITISL